LPDARAPSPISYQVGSTQYVAIVAGGGTSVDSFFAPFTPELPISTSAKSLLVFALPSNPAKGR
ncbi:MAG: hypothetical protein AB7L36_14885, partial [Sphingomonadaceae bacterium]